MRVKEKVNHVYLRSIHWYMNTLKHPNQLSKAKRSFHFLEVFVCDAHARPWRYATKYNIILYCLLIVKWPKMGSLFVILMINVRWSVAHIVCASKIVCATINHVKHCSSHLQLNSVHGHYRNTHHILCVLASCKLNKQTIFYMLVHESFITIVNKLQIIIVVYQKWWLHTILKTNAFFLNPISLW